ncbi:glycerophosphodiester phosphodiesterase [Mycobacterium sp. KBS0706]|uniref:glycerophosphodiester phosphodiesterase n=1 Tax=Mycobacterium sp. KBS0706 TaxID=2578109 RepID=UPI00110FC2D1|nr:glycerophosphodiester phosphodiesterase family protein [Mycobacterium sp. KBS0706]TSD89203.1 glycerophosphodiester phosphodiesterase [Mycobacterium sp. KBS0706]
MPDGIEIVSGDHRTRLKWHRLQRRPEDIPFTPARLREGMVLGASMEVDLRRRADGGFACLHDETLDRETTGHGPVAAAGVGDLRALRMRGNDGTPTEGRLLLLEDLAELAATGADPATLVQLDLKEADAALDERSVDAFCATLAPVAGRFILSGGDWTAVRRLGADVLRLGFDPCDDDTLSKLVTSAAAERFIAAALERAPEAAMIYLSWPIVLRADALGVDLIAACHAAGKSVDAWTLNPDHPGAAAALARLVALRADQITTDAPGVLEAMFGATRRP